MQIAKEKRNYILFVISVIFLAFISFYSAFNFAFIVDDWSQLWGVFYDRSIIEIYLLTQHPNSAYEFLLLAPIFKFNPFYYQIVGFILKIIASLSVTLFVFSITRLKNIAIFSGLIFASSVIGIEVFTRISAQNSALLIPTLCLAFYFWIQVKQNRAFCFLSIFFAVLSILGDPGTGIMILSILFVWNLLELYQNFNMPELRRFLVVSFLLLITLISLKFYLDPRLAYRQEYMYEHVFFVLAHIPYTVSNFLTSIGNLVIGWVIPFKEDMGLATANLISTIFGYLFLFYTMFLGYKFFRKKSENLKILLFLSIWVFLFYFPSWFTQGHYVKGGTISAASNRYLAISSIGFIAMLSFLLKFLKNRYAYIILMVIISLNLISSSRILNDEYKYRSVEVQNKLYGKIGQELPLGKEKDDLLLFLGNNALRIFGIEWNGFYPVALTRGITDMNEFPTLVYDLQTAKDYICPTKESSLKFKLSNLYAWEVQNDNIVNVSEDVRKFISFDKECKFIP